MNRMGVIEGLKNHPLIASIQGVTHSQALGWSDEWDDVDIAFVDAADENTDAADKLPGVAVVLRIRAQQATRRALIVVITNYFFHDGLRWRMHDAGPDLFFHRSELPTAADLIELVIHSERFLPTHPVPPVSQTTLDSLGVGKYTRVNEFVHFVETEGLADKVASASGDDLHTREWKRTRFRLGVAAKIVPVNTDGSPSPHQERDAPSTPQLRKLLHWLTAVDPTRPPKR